jgi:hypothetical protein
MLPIGHTRDASADCCTALYVGGRMGAPSYPTGLVLRLFVLRYPILQCWDVVMHCCMLLLLPNDTATVCLVCPQVLNDVVNSSSYGRNYENKKVDRPQVGGRGWGGAGSLCWQPTLFLGTLSATYA